MGGRSTLGGRSIRVPVLADTDYVARIYVTDDNNKTIAVFQLHEDDDALWGHNLQATLPNMVTAVTQLFQEGHQHARVRSIQS